MAQHEHRNFEKRAGEKQIFSSSIPFFASLTCTSVTPRYYCYSIFPIPSHPSTINARLASSSVLLCTCNPPSCTGSLPYRAARTAHVASHNPTCIRSRPILSPPLQRSWRDAQHRRAPQLTVSIHRRLCSICKPLRVTYHTYNTRSQISPTNSCDLPTNTATHRLCDKDKTATAPSPSVLPRNSTNPTTQIQTRKSYAKGPASQNYDVNHVSPLLLPYPLQRKKGSLGNVLQVEKKRVARKINNLHCYGRSTCLSDLFFILHWGHLSFGCLGWHPPTEIWVLVLDLAGYRYLLLSHSPSLSFCAMMSRPRQCPPL